MKKPGRLIVFFVPPQKVVSGGILSIFSLTRVSRELKMIHKAEVRICVYPGHESYRTNDLFVNDETITSFDELVAEGPLEYLQLHIPEYASTEVYEKITPYKDFLGAISELKVNILDQNVLLMPTPEDLALWFEITPHVTQTTAHSRYATQALSDIYYTPVHHLSTYLDAKQYNKLPYEQKQNIILLSPDEHQSRSAIVEELSRGFPDYSIITVSDMRYEDYKELMGRSKYAVTFGEGFDGYYLEAFFTGGVTFAVYNDNFFPNSSFAKFSNTYSTYEHMLAHIVKDMRKIDDKSKYDKLSLENLSAISSLYSYKDYKSNVKRFYGEQYTYLPGPWSAAGIMARLVEKNKDLHSKNQQLDNHIARLNQSLSEQEANVLQGIEVARVLESTIEDMSASLSWKITKPLRSAKGALNKKD